MRPERFFYQIFPDGFANGDPSNDPPDTANGAPWPTLWKADLRPFVQHLIAIRSARQPLRRGHFGRLPTGPATGPWVFARTLAGEHTVAVMNLFERPLEDSMPLTLQTGSLSLSLAPWAGVYITA